jgi:cytidine deaminase
MRTYPLTANDFKLIGEAKSIITRLYEDDKHHVGAALLSNSGNIISSVHIEAYVGRVTVCAEAIAIGSAISSGENGFNTIVAVRHPYSDEKNRDLKVVSPCGMCRELIFDYSPECFVILEMNGELLKTKIGELIPLKYCRQ